MTFNVVLKLFGLREISTKNYSVQRSTDVIQFERSQQRTAVMVSVALTLFTLREISTKNYTICVFNVVLKFFGLREISTKNYSDVHRGIDVIQFERDLNKEL